MLAATASGLTEYSRAGTGPAVLLVHGGHSNCGEEFGVPELLDAGFSVVIPSRPGYGRTPLSTGPTAETSAAGFPKKYPA